MLSYRRRPERSRRRVWLGLSAILVGAILLGGPAVVAYRVANPGQVAGAVALEGARDVSFGELKGSYLPGGETTVIFLHGYGLDRAQQGHGEALARALQGSGFSVLLYDQRSPGSFGPRETEDVPKAIAFARSQGARRVALVGWGLGAATSLHAVARGAEASAMVLIDPALEPTAELDRAIDEKSPLPQFFFATYTRWLAGLAYGLRPGELKPLNDAARAAPRPVLVVAREGAAAGAQQLLSVTGQAGNELYVVPEQEYAAGAAGYAQKVAAFLSRSIKP